MMRSRS